MRTPFSTPSSDVLLFLFFTALFAVIVAHHG